jgi:hypothetical protein
MNDQPASIASDCGLGSLDGEGAGDHDQLFVGYRAYLFSTRQLARLLQVRGEVLEARLGHGRWASDLAACQQA